MIYRAERSAIEGAGFGAAAGLMLMAMESAGAAILGAPPLAPLRLFSSVVLGRSALVDAPLGLVFGVGLLTHLVLSALFGVLYGLIYAQLAHDGQRSYGVQAGLGMLFGFLLWLVNFHVIARLFYPWFLDPPQGFQALVHAAFFGLPLGLLFAAEHHVQDTVRPTI
jgi:hypothetical protein